jgi:hypothetical protein
MDMIKLLEDAEKAIATLMLEVNRLTSELEKFEQVAYADQDDLTDSEIVYFLIEKLPDSTIRKIPLYRIKS